jgi:transcription initiation factor TFIIIB Brf1 subunit/transcription initiation factor TFIIB
MTNNLEQSKMPDLEPAAYYSSHCEEISSPIHVQDMEPSRIITDPVEKKQIDTALISYREVVIRSDFKHITKICLENNLPVIVIDTAKNLYVKLIESKSASGKRNIFRGTTKYSIFGACIYESCLLHKMPRTIDNIASFLKIDNKHIVHGIHIYHKITKESEIHNSVS